MNKTAALHLPSKSAIAKSIVLLWLVSATVVAGHASTRSTADTAPRTVSPRGELTPDEKANIAVFKQASPSVVHITTLKRQEDLFTLDAQEVPAGTGTGFVWDADGDIVTNYHVIQDADTAQVTLADQSSYKASLVGAYPDRDIAVLRINAPPSKLKPLAIGRSANLVVGQKVYAIGNPFGLDHTMTMGIVSALNRKIESVTRRPIHGVIQTDAAINPGNSGGPLLDSAGRLVGINTMIYSPNGANAGIGFAIPVDEINRVVPRLIRDGRYIRAGIGISAATPSFNRKMGLPDGVAVIGLVLGGPAQRAGLRPFMRNGWGQIIPGDIITAVNGHDVRSYDQLQEILEAYKIGEQVHLRIWRQSGFAIVSVKLGDLGK